MKNKKMPLNIQLFADEEGSQAVTETEDKTQDTVTQTENKTEEKTFTQDEVNSIVAKERKKMPSKEDLEEFNKWKESQKSEADKRDELTQKLATTENEKASLKHENLVLKTGVNVEDVDYVLFKVEKMEGDFEDNLKDFLKDNPKYLQKESVTDNQSKDTGASVNKNNNVAESGVKAILKEKHPELFN